MRGMRVMRDVRDVRLVRVVRDVRLMRVVRDVCAGCAQCSVSPAAGRTRRPSWMSLRRRPSSRGRRPQRCAIAEHRRRRPRWCAVVEPHRCVRIEAEGRFAQRSEGGGRRPRRGDMSEAECPAAPVSRPGPQASLGRVPPTCRRAGRQACLGRLRLIDLRPRRQASLHRPLQASLGRLRRDSPLRCLRAGWPPWPQTSSSLLIAAQREWPNITLPLFKLRCAVTETGSRRGCSANP